MTLTADRWPACLPAGQIELYTHHPFLPTLVRNLQRLGMRTSAVYLLESQFMEDKYKFFRCVMKISILILLALRLACVYFADGREWWRRHTLRMHIILSLRKWRDRFPAPVRNNFIWIHALCPSSANPAFLDHL